jgi:hypothetical protein
MKRQIPVMLVFISLIAGNVAAESQQKPFSLFADVGYGFPFGGESIGPSNTFSGGNATPTKTRDVYLNYGTGIKAEAGAAYDLMKNVGLQAGFDFSGSAPRATVKTLSSNTVAGITTLDTITATYRYALVGVKCRIVPRFTVFDLFDMYTGVGIGLYFPSSEYNLKNVLVASSTTGTVKTTQTEHRKYTFDPSFGLTGAVGAEYPLLESLILTGEICFQAQSLTITKEDIDQSDFIATTTNYYQYNVADRAAPPKVPASNWSIRFGVRVPLF